MSNSTTPITFSFSTELNSADQIQRKLYNALDQLSDVAADIEKIGPDLIVCRGREFKKSDILAELATMMAFTEKTDSYLQQFSKTQNSSSKI